MYDLLTIGGGASCTRGVRNVLTVLFLVLSMAAWSQRGKDGNKVVNANNIIVNEFTSLTADANQGDIIITVQNSGLNGNGRFNGALQPGDLVMIIQMQGATLGGNANDSTWGEITNYNNSGNHEFKEVLSVPSATTIEFTCPIINDYTAAGKTQVIRLPRYGNLTINNGGRLITENWNGATGGVLAVEVLGATLINAGGFMDVVAAGFRGGIRDNNTDWDFVPFVSNNNRYGGEKGESIAGFGADYDAYGGRYCRGAPANGGGGGNAHNAGGGGGANAGIPANWNGNGNPDNALPGWTQAWNLEYAGFANNQSDGGGRGGYTYSRNNRDAITTPPDDNNWAGDWRQNVGGKGGRPLDYTTGKIFLGGGGGAGDGNNSASNGGANGGGMVYILSYGTIGGNGEILANGFDALNTIAGGNDAPGGGGGGGTVILNSTGAITGITIRANGGKGGNQIITCCGDEGEGPGGGGGGGYICLTNGNPTMEVMGGANGVSDSRGVTEFIPNGATAGGAGQTDTKATDLFELETTGDTVCMGSTADLVASINGNAPPGTQMYWYTTSTGGTSFNTGGSYTTGPLTSDTTLYVGTCVGTFRMPVSVVVTPFPTITLTKNDVTCKNLNNGQISANVSGGSPPYTYNWSTTPASSDNPLTGLSPGTYAVTVTDDEGCSSNASEVITEPSFLIATITDKTDANCNGGSATVSASGGTPPYSYSWSPVGGNGTTATNLSAGSYIVIVTDSNGCQGLANVTIDAINPLDGTVSSTMVTCSGASDGSVGVSVTGGVTPYSYLWNNGATGDVASGLSVGTYQVTITDSASCEIYLTADVTEPLPLAISVTANLNAFCGMANGVLVANVSGGTGGNTYNWAPGGMTTATVDNLSVGTYSITATDVNGCSVTGSEQITAIPPPSFNDSIVNILCNDGNDGKIILNTSGGLAPYTYIWVPSGHTTDNLNNLSAGTYTVTATDAMGCSETGSFVVTETPKVDIVYSITDATCGIANGQISISVSGGTAPYIYLWSGGQNTATITGLNAGTYRVTVTDANGCRSVRSKAVNNITGPSITASQSDVSCNAGNDGTATVVPAGGTPPYTFQWMPGAHTNAVATGLTVGFYDVSVTDQNGCIAATSVEIDEPAVVGTVVNNTPALCFAGNEGTATAIPFGGTPGYTYLWSTGATDSVATGLSAGTYTVTVYDAHLCNTVGSVTITEPAQLTVADTVTHVSCSGGNDGGATLTVGGGTAPYQYDWAPVGGADSTRSGLSAGAYTVTVVDGNGCQLVRNITINEPSPVGGAVDLKSDALCNGSDDGWISVSVSGGSPSYTYQWSPSGATTALSGNLSPGTYFVTVSDANGCLVYLNETIGEPTLLSTLGVEVFPTYCGQAIGNIRVDVSGGTGPYQYMWTGGYTTDTVSNVTAGTHYVTVTDDNGCVSIDSALVNDIPAGDISLTGIVPASCAGSSDGSATVTMTGGVAPFVYTWNPPAGNAATATGLPAGMFYVTVTDAKGCMDVDSGLITEPVPLLGQIDSIQPISCTEENDGAIWVSANGGTSPYSYEWNTNPPLATSVINNLGPFHYFVTVTDANGCLLVMDTTIVDPGAIVGTTTAVSHITCNGGSDGGATVSATGGTGPYTYLWSTGETSDTISDLPVGSYVVTITDQNGCVDSASIMLMENDIVSTLANWPGDICPGDSVQIRANATGGGSDYYYFIWSHGLDSDSVHMVGPPTNTTYYVTAIDEFGCTGPMDSLTVNLKVLDPADVVTGQPDTICSGDTANVFVTNLDPSDSLTYVWSSGLGNGPGPFDVTPTTRTTYAVTVTNGCGASLADSVTIDVIEIPVVLLMDPDSGCAPTTIDFSSQLLDTSVAITRWLWDLGDGTTDTTMNPSRTYDVPGFYPITLTIDVTSGCTFTLPASSFVKIYDKPIADFDPVPGLGEVLRPILFNDRSFDAVTWLWEFGDTAGSTSNQQNPIFVYSDSGYYNVRLIVSNIHGCVDTIIKPVGVKPIYAWYVPNAFSPNGDGINERFFPKGDLNPDEFTMYIFDRWGNEIFRTSSFDGWDGTANEGTEIQQEDVYVWLIEGTDLEGTPVKEIGHVTLVK